MLKISLAEKVGNKQVLYWAGAKREMMRMIRWRKANVWLEGLMADEVEEDQALVFWIVCQNLQEEERDRWNCCGWRAGEKTGDVWWSMSMGERHRSKGKYWYHLANRHYDYVKWENKSFYSSYEASKIYEIVSHRNGILGKLSPKLPRTSLIKLWT